MKKRLLIVTALLFGILSFTPQQNQSNAQTTQPDTNSTVSTDTTPPDITAQIDPPPNAAGWNTTNVTVTWTVTDDESAITSTDGCDKTTIDKDTDGTAFTCAATSSGGTSSKTVTIKRDSLAPVIYYIRPAPDIFDWYNKDATINFYCSERHLVEGTAGSGIAIDTITGYSVTVTPENTGWLYTTGHGECTDNAGNIAEHIGLWMLVDETPPVISFSSSAPVANSFGWNNSDVTVEWSCSDKLSCPMALSYTKTVSDEGDNQSAEGICEDLALNTATDTYTGINIDKTAPEVSITSPGNKSYTGSVPIAATFSDSLSGVDNTSKVYLLDDKPVSSNITDLIYAYILPGTHTFSVKISDKAGNISPAKTVTFTYSAPTTTTITDITKQMYADTSITKLGSSIYNKLSLAESYINSGNKSQAINILRALINQINAQNDINIKTEAARILIQQINSLINSLL